MAGPETSEPGIEEAASAEVVVNQASSLADRLERARSGRQQHERSFEENIAEHDRLIASAKELSQQRQEAIALREQYQAEVQSEELSPDGHAKLEEVEKLIRDLQVESERVNSRIAEIAQDPKVSAHLQSEAVTEDQEERRKNFLVDGWERELGKNGVDDYVSRVAETILKYDATKTELAGNSRQENENSRAMQQLYQGLIEKLSARTKDAMPKQWFGVERGEIENLRSSLGFTQGKDKSILGKVLKNMGAFEDAMRTFDAFRDRNTESLRHEWQKPIEQLRNSRDIINRFLGKRLEELQVVGPERDEFLGRVTRKLQDKIFSRIGVPEGTQLGLSRDEALKSGLTPEQAQRYELFSQV